MSDFGGFEMMCSVMFIFLLIRLDMWLLNCILRWMFGYVCLNVISSGDISRCFSFVGIDRCMLFCSDLFSDEISVLVVVILCRMLWLCL